MEGNVMYFSIISLTIDELQDFFKGINYSIVFSSRIDRKTVVVFGSDEATRIAKSKCRDAMVDFIESWSNV